MNVLRWGWDRAPQSIRDRVLMFRYGAPGERQWIREVMNREVQGWIAALPPERHSAVEVSGTLRADFAWQRYASLHYPAFDLCRPSGVGETFDIVICEQVLEHVVDPIAAVKTLHRLCTPGGCVLVSTPFMYRLHAAPGDYWRFTPTGLSILLEAAGFRIERLRSWGNAAAVRRNLGRALPYRPWRSLRNTPHLPVVVWAVARRPE
jgi:SAM-dependent methyltransferase